MFEDLARNLAVPHALGMTTVLVVPEGTREVFRERGHYSKYRATAGVTLPWTVLLERDGEKIFEMFVEDMEVNKGLEDSVFQLKKGVKILPQEK